MIAKLADCPHYATSSKKCPQSECDFCDKKLTNDSFNLARTYVLLKLKKSLVSLPYVAKCVSIFLGTFPQLVFGLEIEFYIYI